MSNFFIDLNLFNNDYYFYERLLILLFSLLPTVLLIILTLKTDKINKEPKKNIIICLLSGILTISLASYFENIAISFFSSNVILTYLCAMIEEICKIIIFMLFIYDNKYYDEIYDGIVYMALIALSFAGLENIMYAFSESTVTNSIVLSILRDFTTIPLHVICGIVIGYFMSLSNFSKDKKNKYRNLFLAIIIPSLIHGTYNFIMGIIGNYDSMLLIMLLQVIPILLVIFALLYIAKNIIENTFYLNKMYVNNKEYIKQYNYLMNNEEYLNSEFRNKRLNMYIKTKINKEGDKND